MTDTCPHGHPWTPDNTAWQRTSRGTLQRECRACRRQQRADERAAAFDQRHAGHDITHDAAGRRRCLTCPPTPRGWDIDAAAVWRAIDGRAPRALTAGERAAAAVVLHRSGLTGKEIADRLGCADRTVRRALARARDAA